MPSTDFAENVALSAPGLAINAAGSATVKYANTFTFKANSRISTSITTALAPALTTAVMLAPFPNGTAATAGVLATGFGRTYTLVATLPISGTSVNTPTFSWLVSPDFSSTLDSVSISNFLDPNQSNQSAIGYVTILNNSGSNFTPGTTALDAAGLTVTYLDNNKVMGS